MAISNSLSLTGTLLANQTSGSLYTCPASRYAKVTLTAGGPAQPQVLTMSASVGPGLILNQPTIAGQILLSIPTPSTLIKTALSKTAGDPNGPYAIVINTINNGVDAFVQNSAGVGLHMNAGVNPQRTLGDIINSLNTYIHTTLGGPVAALTFTVPADANILVTNASLGSATWVATIANVPAVQVNGDATAFSDIDVEIDQGTVFASKSGSFTISAGQSLQVKNSSNTASTTYELSVVEFSN